LEKSGRRPGSISSEWRTVVDEVPADLDIVRYWHLAATEKTGFNEPDWTVASSSAAIRTAAIGLLDTVRGRANPGAIEHLLRNSAKRVLHRVRPRSSHRIPRQIEHVLE
jgi:hypothetical protein